MHSGDLGPLALTLWSGRHNHTHTSHRGSQSGSQNFAPLVADSPFSPFIYAPTLPQPHLPLFFLPQGLCTGCALCLELLFPTRLTCSFSSLLKPPLFSKAHFVSLFNPEKLQETGLLFLALSFSFALVPPQLGVVHILLFILLIVSRSSVRAGIFVSPAPGTVPGT